MSTRCKACGAEIVFVAHDMSGRLMPLNAKPEKRIVLVDNAGYPGVRRDDVTTRCRVVDTYISHFVDCPQADVFKQGA